MIPKDLKYTKQHEWVRFTDQEAVIGITQHATVQLGEITFVDLPNEGDNLEQREVLGSVESVKAVSDIYSPVAGTVIEVNSEIQDHPEYVNEDPYGKGWMLKLKADDTQDSSLLMSPEAYEDLL